MRSITLVFLVLAGNLTAQSTSSISKKERYSESINRINLNPEQEAKLRSTYQNSTQTIQKMREVNLQYSDSIERKLQEELQVILIPIKEKK
jgi:ABC-type transport system involved in cytochrome bd biosynthesis fused ATPase/permease subunit